MSKNRIKATVCQENALWVGLFERVDDREFSAARVIFGKEPSDSELYEWIQQNFDQLKFSTPQEWVVSIKRKNPKRVLREVKKELKKTRNVVKKESFAQEALRIELEKQKQHRLVKSRLEEEAEKEHQFLLNQEKKKKKKRGH